MSKQTLPANVGSNDGLGVTLGARWYAVGRQGMATLCVDEQDAVDVAARSNFEWPNHAPYRAVQLVDVCAVAGERERCAAQCRELAAMWRSQDGNSKRAEVAEGCADMIHGA